jgi:hypothetical protein
MKFEAKALRDAIGEGIKSRARLAMLLTGERREDPTPEYLTTASVCISLGDFVAELRATGQLKIHAEEMTKDVWARERAHSLLRQRNARKCKQVKMRAWRKRRVNSTRNGNVDITLMHGSSFEKPFAVIENKGVLSFRNDGELGAGSDAEVRKDLIRNREFFTAQGSTGGVEYTAFTFFLRDNESCLRDQGLAFCKAKKAYFEGYLQKLNLPSYLRTQVLVDTFDDDLYEDDSAAEKPDECGAPAIDMHPPWHLAYGIISMYRVGEVISDDLHLQDLATE